MYRCRGCQRYSSVCTGTVMASCPTPLSGALAIYFDVSGWQEISSVSLARYLGGHVEAGMAHVLQRIREVFAGVKENGPVSRFMGWVEVDETLTRWTGVVQVTGGPAMTREAKNEPGRQDTGDRHEG